MSNEQADGRAVTSMPLTTIELYRALSLAAIRWAMADQAADHRAAELCTFGKERDADPGNEELRQKHDAAILALVSACDFAGTCDLEMKLIARRLTAQLEVA